MTGFTSSPVEGPTTMFYGRIVARWLVRLALTVLLGLVGFAVAVLIVLPRATHGVALTVLTGSMTPKIPVGSVVIDRPVDPGTLKVGDIATYQETPGKPVYITHRIVEINTKTNPVTFTFKGDANRGPDMNPVPATAIRGKVWFHVPYLGAIRDSLQSHGMRGLALLGAIFGLAGFGIYQIVSSARDRKRRDPLRLHFPAGAFEELPPSAIARLFGGECAVDAESGAITMTFSGDSARRAVIADLLSAYQAAPESCEHVDAVSNRQAMARG